MKRSEAQNAIAIRLFNSGLFSFDKMSLPGKKFDIPASGEWCRLTFGDGASEQKSIGGDEVCVRFQRDQRFAVQVFTEQGVGNQRCLDLAESVADLYEKQRGDKPVTYKSPDVNEPGIEPDGWYQSNVTVEYDFNVVK